MDRGRRSARGLAAGLIALAVVAASCGAADEDQMAPSSSTTVAIAVTTVAVAVATTAEPPSTTSSPVVTAPTADPAGSTGDPAASTTTPSPTTTLDGGPIPEAPDWFCAELAVESAELVVEVEAVLPADGSIDPRSQHTLLLATRNLLAWTNNRVPDELRPDVGLLNRVYADLGIELDRLDPDTVTLPRLQALVFAYVLDSPVVDATELDLSARRLAAYVDRSCGHGFPIMEAMADLFTPTAGGG